MKLKSIKGLLPEKHQVYGNENVRTKARKENRNRLINQIGDKDFPKMDREVLLRILKDTYHDYQHGKIPEGISGAEYMANAIIANQDELFEVK
jgi:hypothetical protein